MINHWSQIIDENKTRVVHITTWTKCVLLLTHVVGRLQKTSFQEIFFLAYYNNI